MPTTDNLQRLAELLAQEAHAKRVPLATYVQESTMILTPARRAEILALAEQCPLTYPAS